jgi:hypothetical protein
MVTLRQVAKAVGAHLKVQGSRRKPESNPTTGCYRSERLNEAEQADGDDR